MSKKTIWLVVILVAVVVSLGGYFYFQQWWGVKQQKIERGLASDKFPWRDYTPEELSKLYPQIKYANVPTRVTPEETYGKFREALRTNNLELALKQLAGEGKRYGENVSDMQQAYKGNRFAEIYNNYPEKIFQANMYESIAQYYFNYKENDTSKTHFINFIKDVNGDWKMDSL